MGKYGLEAPSLDGAQWGLGKTGLNDDDTEVLCRRWMQPSQVHQLKELNLAHNHVGDRGLDALTRCATDGVH